MTQSGKAVRLPVKNDLGFYEIRMESIGLPAGPLSSRLLGWEHHRR